MFSKRRAGPFFSRTRRAIAPISWSQSTSAVIRRRFSSFSRRVIHCRMSMKLIRLPAFGWFSAAAGERRCTALDSVRGRFDAIAVSSASPRNENLAKTLGRTNDVDDRLAFLHSHCPQTALECRHHFSRIGDFLAVAVGNFDGLLVIRGTIQEGDRLVLVLCRKALLM